MSSLVHMPVANEMLSLAALMHKGGLTPKNVTKPEQIAARILAGREVGLGPVQSVNWIMVVGGRATIWGDAALALVRASGLLVEIEERWEGEGDAREAVCVTKRVGPTIAGRAALPDQTKETRFSVADAKQARLWGKEGPWTDYPDRQLMWRARGWNLRDAFGDVLCGLGITEEELDRESVAVRQVDVVDVADAKPPAGESKDDGGPWIDEATLAALSQARPGWLRAKGIDADDADAVKAAWLEALTPFGVTTAKALTMDQAKKLLDVVATVGHAQEVKEVFEEAGSASS